MSRDWVSLITSYAARAPASVDLSKGVIAGCRDEIRRYLGRIEPSSEYNATLFTPIRTPFDNDPAIFRFVAVKDLELIAWILAAGKIDVNRQSSTGETLLIRAAKTKGAEEILKKILETELFINRVDKNKQSPIMHAVILGNIDNVRVLLYAGASINRPDSHNRIPLSQAVLAAEASQGDQQKKSYTAIVQLLLEHGAGIGASLPEEISSLSINFTNILLVGATLAVSNKENELVRSCKLPASMGAAILRLEEFNRNVLEHRTIRRRCSERLLVERNEYKRDVLVTLFKKSRSQFRDLSEIIFWSVYFRFERLEINPGSLFGDAANKIEVSGKENEKALIRMVGSRYDPKEIAIIEGRIMQLEKWKRSTQNYHRYFCYKPRNVLVTAGLSFSLLAALTGLILLILYSIKLSELFDEKEQLDEIKDVSGNKPLSDCPGQRMHRNAVVEFLPEGADPNKYGERIPVSMEVCVPPASGEYSFSRVFPNSTDLVFPNSMNPLIAQKQWYIKQTSFLRRDRYSSAIAGCDTDSVALSMSASGTMYGNNYTELMSRACEKALAGDYVHRYQRPIKDCHSAAVLYKEKLSKDDEQECLAHNARVLDQINAYKNQITGLIDSTYEMLICSIIMFGGGSLIELIGIIYCFNILKLIFKKPSVLLKRFIDSDASSLSKAQQRELHNLFQRLKHESSEEQGLIVGRIHDLVNENGKIKELFQEIDKLIEFYRSEIEKIYEENPQWPTAKSEYADVRIFSPPKTVKERMAKSTDENEVELQDFVEPGSVELKRLIEAVQTEVYNPRPE